MSRLRIVFLIAFLGTCAMATSLHGQAQVRSNIGLLDPYTNGIESTRTELQLVTEILKESYCDGPDPELLSLRLLLRLSFVNIGKKTIIIERGSKSVPVIKISRTDDDVIAHRFETTINNYIITDSNKAPKAPPVPKRPPLSRFAILQAGQTYRTITEVTFPIPRANPVASIIPSGSHYLQIGVWTWDGSQKEAKLRRKKWQRDGFLWSESVLSKAMPFTVVSQPKSEDCRCENSNTSENEAINIATRRMNASSRPSASYKRFAIAQGCEWQVVFEPVDKDPNKPSFIYIIDKNTGRVLEDLR